MTDRPGGAPRATLALLAVAVIALAVLTTFVVIKAQDLSHASSKTSERTKVAALAAQYAVDFSSFDYRHMDEDIAAASKHATSDFAPKYEATVKLFEPLYAHGKVVQTTSVQKAAIESITSTSAKVIVLLKDSVTSTKAPVTTSLRFEITLNLVHGTWLTSDVTPL